MKVQLFDDSNQTVETWDEVEHLNRADKKLMSEEIEILVEQHRKRCELCKGACYIKATITYEGETWKEPVQCHICHGRGYPVKKKVNKNGK